MPSSTSLNSTSALPRSSSRYSKSFSGKFQATTSFANGNSVPQFLSNSSLTPNGFKLEFDKNCGTLFPLANDVGAWNFPENDLLYLLDARGKALVEFSE